MKPKLNHIRRAVTLGSAVGVISMIWTFLMLAAFQIDLPKQEEQTVTQDVMEFTSAILISPMVETVIFHVVLLQACIQFLPRASESNANMWPFLMTATLFTLSHGLLGNTLEEAFVHTLNRVPAAFVITWVATRSIEATGKSFWPAFLCHAANNSAIVATFFLIGYLLDQFG